MVSTRKRTSAMTPATRSVTKRQRLSQSDGRDISNANERQLEEDEPQADEGEEGQQDDEEDASESEDDEGSGAGPPLYILGQLADFWMCGNNDCWNHHNLCFWTNEDVVTSHYRIGLDELREWGWDIMKGQAFFESPSVTMMEKLRQMKKVDRADGLLWEDDEAPPRPNQPQAVTNVYCGPYSGPTPSEPQAQSQSISLSQPRSQSQSQPKARPSLVVNSQSLHTFIKWLKRKPEWTAQRSNLETAECWLQHNEFELETIKDISMSLWSKVWNLKPGLLFRLKREVEPFKVHLFIKEDKNIDKYLHEYFFGWLLGRPALRGHADRLALIGNYLLYQRFDFNSIGDITIDIWQSWGFEVGLLFIIKREMAGFSNLQKNDGVY